MPFTILKSDMQFGLRRVLAVTAIACLLLATIRWTRDFTTEHNAFVQKLRLIRIDVTTRAEAEQILGEGSRGARHGQLTVYKYINNWDLYYNDEDIVVAISNASAF